MWIAKGSQLWKDVEAEPPGKMESQVQRSRGRNMLCVLIEDERWPMWMEGILLAEAMGR